MSSRPGRTPARPPVPLGPGPLGSRLPGPAAGVDDALLTRLRSACAAVDTGEEARAEAGRDWWPLALHWARRGQVPALPAAVARPASAAEVADVLACCGEAGLPITISGGRSGVCGASVPVFGGLSLDMCGLAGLTDVDDASLLVTAGAGTFGLDLEEQLRAGPGLTLGHWPQSIALSTVGGWVACRSAGQYSTRYGKVEDMVAGLEVVMADGRRVTTGGRAPRTATGPDLTGLFVGSEGTLGVITSALLRAHPAPPAEERAAWSFPTMEAGLDACRRTLRRGATPAVLRLYDPDESARSFSAGGGCLLVALDEGDPGLVRTAMEALGQECAKAGGAAADPAVVGRWLESRNDISALGPLVEGGFVVDTVEVAGRWSALPGLYRSALGALRSLEGTVAASAHQSHAYPDGACLYVTFAGRHPGGDGDPGWAEGYYRRAWEAVMSATLAEGAAISHHHGIGLNRGPWLAADLGTGMGVLAAVKAALDPAGILNPGKLGLESPFGPPPWP